MTVMKMKAAAPKPIDARLRPCTAMVKDTPKRANATTMEAMPKIVVVLTGCTFPATAPSTQREAT